MRLWVVGKYIKGEYPDIVWEFCGVFLTKKKAIKACIKPDYFCGPAKLNEASKDESVDWEGAFYPLYKE